MKDSKKVPALIPYYIPEKNIGKFVLSVIHRLESKSFATYIVGGFIRDHALDLNPKDIDLVSEATPSQIKKCFRNARVIGKRFRLVHLYGPDGSILELSTFRKTPSQKDLEEVRKTRFISKVREKHLANNIYGDAGEDAQRRDFTVNAILYSPTRKVIVDYTGGFKDLNKKRIEMIGNVKDRFLEDPVRIIRACKLSGKQGLTMPNNIANSIRGQVKLIADVPRSRLYEEFLKILKSGYSLTILKKLKRFGVLKVWLPVIQRCLSKGSPLYNVLEAIDSAILSGKNELYDDHILGLVSLLCFAIDEKDSYSRSPWLFRN